MTVKVLQVPQGLYNLAQQLPPPWRPIMGVDTEGLPLCFLRAEGWKGHGPLPPAQLVQAWGATGHQAALSGPCYEEGVPFWKGHAVVGWKL